MFETGTSLLAQGVKNLLPVSSKLPTTRIVEYANPLLSLMTCEL